MKKRFKKEELIKLERALLAKKRLLLKQRKVTDEVMESTLPNTTGESVRRTHPADQGTENYQREMASRLKSIESKTLREIETALRRINKGTYGICERCGRPIPKARLLVVPHARFCMKCLKEQK